MAWTIRFSDRASRQLAKLDSQVGRRVIQFLEERLAEMDDPRRLGRPLKGSEFNEYWRFRVGDYRILCDIREAELVILALAVGHRKEIYRG